MRRCPPTCMCPLHDEDGGGDSAVRAFVEGDRSALDRLSPAVAQILPSLMVLDDNPTEAALDGRR